MTAMILSLMKGQPEEEPESDDDKEEEMPLAAEKTEPETKALWCLSLALMKC